jgi:hypothetical protein
MELDNWKTLLTTCVNYDELIQFIKKNTKQIKELNLLHSDHNIIRFIDTVKCLI